MTHTKSIANHIVGVSDKKGYNMNIANISDSYNQALYDVGESNRKDRDSVSAKMSVNSQDAYIPAGKETYFTYTSNGVIAGEELSTVENEKSCILPERYNGSKSCYIYYQGKRISEYELIQIAVETEAITLDESKPIGWNTSNAYDALMYSKATPLYDWSTTLYSEDRMYVYRVENGQITGGTATWYSDGTTFQDTADAIASGTPLSEMDRSRLHDLMLYDRELYDAAVNIGTAKREYDTFTNMYQNGQLTEKQFKHDCYPLLLLLFGKDADTHSASLLKDMDDFFSADDFLTQAFARYNPDHEKLRSDLFANKNYHAYSGMY